MTSTNDEVTQVPVQNIDAQTFDGIDNDSLDFVISAHVIEHLRDPIGSIVNAIRVLKAGGIPP